MLSEFVKAISELAVRAKEPTMFRDECDPRKAYLVHDGVLKETTVTPPLLHARVDTVASLMQSLDTFSSENGTASIWHSRHTIVALLDNDDRLEICEMPLRFSEQFLSLTSLPKAFEQKALILFLKRNLNGAVDDTLISAFRRIDFAKREEGKTNISHGEESLGRSVQASVTGALDIPEFMTATVSVYANADIRVPVTIRLSVDINVRDGLIELTPLPDVLENAIVEAQEAIAERLEGEYAVFYGSPSCIPNGSGQSCCNVPSNPPHEQAVTKTYKESQRKNRS